MTLSSHTATAFRSSAASRQLALGTSLTSFLLLLWWLLAMQQSALVIGPPPVDTGGAPQATQEGSVANVVLVTMLAAAGLWYLRGSYKLILARGNRALLVASAFYILWSLASLIWSDDPSLSVRRLTQLVLLVVGGVGLGVGFYGKQSGGFVLLLQHVVIAALIAQLALWGPLIADGNIRFLDPSWSVKDQVGSPVGFPTAFGFFAGLYLMRRATSARQRVLLISFLCVCALTLFAQKMRMVQASVLILFLLFVVGAVSTRLRLVVLTFLGFASILAVESTQIFGNVFAPILDTVWAYATLDGSLNDTTSLTGRVPLWDALSQAIQQSPWIGYGFGAFWTPDNLVLVNQQVHWTAVTAHNGFLDEVLGTGAIGLALFLVAWLLGMTRAWQLRRSAPHVGLVVFGWMLLFLLFNTAGSILQWYFQFPFYVSLAGVAALIGIHTTGREAGRQRAQRPRGFETTS